MKSEKLSIEKAGRKPASARRAKQSAVSCRQAFVPFRIIDANLNRCREGLRVVEDCLRYVLNDSALYKTIRTVRHETDKVLRNDYAVLIKERDSVADGGRHMPETVKKELQAVITANFKRAQESLRVLEEYSKTVFPEVSPLFKEQRYKVYNLEKEVFLKYESALRF
jgi:thiamine-phosphate pyrophosphorylase